MGEKMKKILVLMAAFLVLFSGFVAATSMHRTALIREYDYPIAATLYPDVETGKVYITDTVTGVKETQKRMDISNIPSNAIISTAKYCMKTTSGYEQQTFEVSRITDQEWNPLTITPQEYINQGPQDTYVVSTTQKDDVWSCIDVKSILQHEVYLGYGWFSFRMHEYGSSVSNFNMLNFWDPYMYVGQEQFWYYMPGGDKSEFPYLEVRIFRLPIFIE